MHLENDLLDQSTLLGPIRKQIYESMPPLGVPSMTVSNSETNRMLPRADNIKLTHEALRDIYQEGLRMGAVDSIRVSDEITAEVSSTVPAAGHTPYGIAHKKAQDCWDKTLVGHANYVRPSDFDSPHMVVGLEDGHAQYVPAQLITWLMLKLKTGPDPKDYVMAPIDVYELAQSAQDGEISIRFNNEEKRVRIDNDMLTQIYASVEEHLKIHEEYLTSAYNQHILPEMNRRLEKLEIKLGERKIGSLVHTMALGYSRDEKKETGIGGGVQSNPTAHMHTTMYPDLDELRRLVISSFIPEPERVPDTQAIESSGKFSAKAIYRTAVKLDANRQIPDEELIAELKQYTDIKLIHKWLREQRGWTGEDEEDIDAIKRALLQLVKGVDNVMVGMKKVFAFGEPVLGGLSFEDPEDSKKVPPHVIFKQVDPYSTIFHKHMDSWVQEELHEAFGDLGVSQDQISSFKWETKEHRFDMRVTEGWELTVPDSDFTTVNLSLNKFLGKMNTLWQEGREAWTTWQTRRDETQLQELQSKYNLTPEVVKLIKKILPTDQQLKHWLTYTPPGASDDDMQRLEAQILKRMRPEMRARAMRAIENHPDLSMRVLASGIFEVLENGPIEGTIYQVNGYRFNHGLNIPGVPSFGIAYEQMKGGWKIRIHPLISEKGLAEFVAGCQFIREKGN